MEYIKIDNLHPNKGQIPGLKTNPRKIDDIDKLCQSIKEIPYFLEARPIVVYPYNEQLVIIAGNQRYKAAKIIGMESVPVYCLNPETPLEELEQIAIIDNTHSGKWDKAKLKDWNIKPHWNLDVTQRAINKAWEKNQNKFILEQKIKVLAKDDFLFISLYEKTESGQTLEEIKADFSNAEPIADASIKTIRQMIGDNLVNGDWCILTTPKRRHKTHNFASEICERIAKAFRIKFYEDALIAKNKQRIGAEFELTKNIREANVILFDDIITTGSTLIASKKCLTGKNVFIIAAINNN